MYLRDAKCILCWRRAGIIEFSQTKLANTGTRRIIWNLAVIEINWYRNKIFNNNANLTTAEKNRLTANIPRVREIASLQTTGW